MNEKDNSEDAPLYTHIQKCHDGTEIDSDSDSDLKIEEGYESDTPEEAKWREFEIPEINAPQKEVISDEDHEIMQQIAQKARETEKIERARFERMLADEREEHAKSILRAEYSIAERQARETEEAEKRAQLRSQDEKDSMISMYDGDDRCSIRNRWKPTNLCIDLRN